MSEPISIRDLLALLRNEKQDTQVYLDTPGRPRPTTVQSWRGVYARPALGYSSRPEVNPTVADLIKELELATNGQLYEGWKGGEYSYDKNMLLHIANPGTSEDYVITGIRSNGWSVHLLFEHMEDRWDV